MSDEKSTIPLIFISYAREDAEWLRFVRESLQAGENAGDFDVWADPRMECGTGWELEIEAKLYACDIFILLVSNHSMASPFIINKEIATIQERQDRGEAVHPYPLLMAPTSDAGLKNVDHWNLRPDRENGFSGYSAHECAVHMKKAADEIARIAKRVKDRKIALRPSDPGTRPAGRNVIYDDTMLAPIDIVDLQNPVADCAQLIPVTSRASTYECFDLLPELRCGLETVEVDNIDFSFGVSQITLRLILNDCGIVVGTRLGDGDHPFIRAGGSNDWIITGPTENEVLWRRVLGNTRLCSIEPKKYNKHNIMEIFRKFMIHIILSKTRNWYNIIMEVRCRKYHIKHNIADHNQTKMDINNERILGVFLTQCLESDGGFIKLCTASFDVLEARHDP